MRGASGSVLPSSPPAEAAECPTATKMQQSASCRCRGARMGRCAGRLPATSRCQLHEHRVKIKAYWLETASCFNLIGGVEGVH